MPTKRTLATHRRDNDEQHAGGGGGVARRSSKRARLEDPRSESPTAAKTLALGALTIKPDPDDPVEKVLSLLPQHCPSFSKLSTNLRTRPWHHIDSIPASIKELNLNWPAIIPASRCWVGGASPSVQQIFSFCVDNFAAGDVTVEAADSSQRGTIGEVFFQLLQPPPENPVVAHNIPIEGNGRLDPAAIPATHLLAPPQAVDYSMNVTPTNAIVDIHVDQGTVGLSIGVGGAGDPPFLLVQKIWLLWPPTAKNLALYESLRSTGGARLPRSAGLEHGVIASTGVESGIFLPPGWLHATITVSGGFLAGITFDARAAIGMASRIMAIDIRLFPGNFSMLAPLYCSALQNALTEGEVGSASNEDAVQGWFEIEGSLRGTKFRATAAHSRVCRKLLDVWRGFFTGTGFEAVDRDRCGRCDWKVARGKNGGATTFGAHFWDVHLRVITPEKYRSPYDAAVGVAVGRRKLNR